MVCPHCIGKKSPDYNLIAVVCVVLTVQLYIISHCTVYTDYNLVVSYLSDGNERLSIAGATTATAAWNNSFKFATVVQQGKSENPLQGEQFSQQSKCSVCGPCSVDRQQSSEVEPAGVCHTEHIRVYYA